MQAHLRRPCGCGEWAWTAVALQCEIRENCPANNVCCLVKHTDGTVLSHCTQSCQGGAASAELCDSAAVDAGCNDAGTCSSTGIGTWGLPSGFATCGGRSAQ
jgi:hypothetical protein